MSSVTLQGDNSSEKLGKKRRKEQTSGLEVMGHGNADILMRNMINNQPISGELAKLMNHISSKIEIDDKKVLSKDDKEKTTLSPGANMRNGSGLDVIGSKLVSNRISLEDRKESDERTGSNFTLSKAKILVNKLKSSSEINHITAQSEKSINENDDIEVVEDHLTEQQKKEETDKIFVKLNYDKDIKTLDNLPEIIEVVSQKSNASSSDDDETEYPNLQFPQHFYNNAARDMYRRFELSKEANYVLSGRYWIKAGLSLTAICFLTYALNHNDKSQLKADLLKLANKKTAIASVILMGGVICFFFLLIQINEVKSREIALKNYQSLIELANEDEFPDKESFRLNEESIITRFSSENNMSLEAYIKCVYPKLVELVEKSSTLYFDLNEGLVFLKIK